MPEEAFLSLKKNAKTEINRKKREDDLQKTDPGPRRHVDMLNRGKRGVSELRGEGIG